MKLYELRDALQTVLDGGFVFDSETGEVTFDADNLEALEMEFNDKLEACGIYIKNLEAEASAIKAEMDNLKARYDRINAKSERMRDYLLYNMEQTGTTKMETSKVALSTRSTSKVEITDELGLPKEYWRIKETATPDKTAIKKALNAGESVKGAMLVKSKSLSIK